MSHDNKDLYREKKRALKKAATRSRRQLFKRELEQNPETAHEVEFNFNEHNTSTQYNGMDHDSKRKRDE